MNTWRYRCPDCGNHSLKRNKGDRVAFGKSYPQGEDGAEERKRDREKRWYCDHCQKRRRRVIDKKTGSLVASP